MRSRARGQDKRQEAKKLKALNSGLFYSVRNIDKEVKQLSGGSVDPSDDRKLTVRQPSPAQIDGMNGGVYVCDLKKGRKMREKGGDGEGGRHGWKGWRKKLDE